jgi:hypothetical protein
MGQKHGHQTHNRRTNYWQLRWIFGEDLLEKVRNVTIRQVMEVGKNILEVTEEKWLRWFGHVKRMPGNRLPLKILEWEPEGTRRRGRP